MKTIIFFNNKEDQGKINLVYHFIYMLAELGHRCLAVDLNPQANLSAMLLSEEALETIYSAPNERETLMSGVKPLLSGTGDISDVKIHEISNNIGLLAGDLDLSFFELKLNDSWNKCLEADEAALRVVTSFSRIIKKEAEKFEAEYCIIDVGSNFGALNNAALLAADGVIVPITTDLFSLQGLKNLGTGLNIWRNQWKDRILVNQKTPFSLPDGAMKPLGYVIMQYGIKESRPLRSYLRWANKIPAIYNEFILGNLNAAEIKVENDPGCLAVLKHYHSLIPMAIDAGKPIFLLKPADGAIGAHSQAVLSAYEDFKLFTLKIIEKVNA
jgi:cellulose biosynthesis protein BcsQ